MPDSFSSWPHCQTFGIDRFFKGQKKIQRWGSSKNCGLRALTINLSSQGERLKYGQTILFSAIIWICPMCNGTATVFYTPCIIFLCSLRRKYGWQMIFWSPPWKQVHYHQISFRNIIIRVQAENEKFSRTTFLKRFCPRIDLAPFFWPPEFVFTYLIGLLCGPSGRP